MLSIINCFKTSKLAPNDDKIDKIGLNNTGRVENNKVLLEIML